jgi:flagellar motility protein MotE (MotC chaperone)
MKKIVIVAQVLILVLVALKVASVFGVFQRFNPVADGGMIASQALAQPQSEAQAEPQAQAPGASQAVKPAAAASPAKKAEAPAGFFKTPPVSKDAMEDILVQQRDLAAALAAKKAELDNRENAMRADEQRLVAMRRDITEKIVILKAQEEKLAAQMDEAKEEDIRRYKDMAKVYENTPPAKAGPMMEKLDIKTAAGITMNMKKDKAGALWAYITPQKAVDITRQITRSGGNKTE